MESGRTQESQQPPYLNLDELLSLIPGSNGEVVRRLYDNYKNLFEAAPGSSHNHQAWPGGYIDHVTDAMNISLVLYDTFQTIRPLPFSRSDPPFIMFLHDLEKPFKYTIDDDGNLTDNPAIPDKKARAAVRDKIMSDYGIKLDAQQSNAMRYVEGIRDSEYTNEARIMGELATICHMADTASARLWYNYPLAESDPWRRAKRVNPKAANFVLESELA